MKRSIFIFSALVAAALLAGCVTTGGKEAGPRAAGGEGAGGYPASSYLTATGLGQSESEARNQAVAELSRIFESKVRSEASDRVRLVVGASADESYEQRLESQVRVISNVELKGVEIAKTWQDNSTHYALAVLDRQKAGENWKREIEDVDRKIEGRLSGLGQIRSRLVRYKSLQKVSALWIERQVLESRLGVLGFRAPEAGGYDIKAVFGEITGTKSSMPIFISLSGEHGPAAAAAISEELGRAGFVLTGDRARADVLVEGRVKVTPLELAGSNLKYARAVLDMSVTDSGAGISVGEVSENVRGSHIAYPEAVRSALDRAAGSASRGLVRLLEEEGEVR